MKYVNPLNVDVGSTEIQVDIIALHDVRNYFQVRLVASNAKGTNPRAVVVLPPSY